MARHHTRHLSETDIRALFRALEARKRDDLDNGMVDGHLSLIDRKRFG